MENEEISQIICKEKEGKSTDMHFISKYFKLPGKLKAWSLKLFVYLSFIFTNYFPPALRITLLTCFSFFSLALLYALWLAFSRNDKMQSL